MTRRWNISAALIAATGLLLLSGAAWADDDQPLDCANAVAQSDLNICADQDFKAADKELNAQYKKTRAAMLSTDEDLDDDLKGAGESLLKAQRAWVDYRDGQCEAEGFQARGGSMEPMLVSGCLATLTRQRTKELKELAEGLEN